MIAGAARAALLALLTSSLTLSAGETSHADWKPPCRTSCV